VTTHVGSRHRPQRQRRAEPEMNTAPSERRKFRPQQPYDDPAQGEFSWDTASRQATQAYGLPDAVYTASDPQYVTVDAANADAGARYDDGSAYRADVGAPYSGPDAPYTDADAPYTDADAPYTDVDAAYAGPGEPYADASAAYADAGAACAGPGEPYADAGAAYADLGMAYAGVEAAFAAADARYADSGARDTAADPAYDDAGDSYDPANTDYGAADAQYATGGAGYANATPEYGTAAAQRWDGYDGVAPAAEPAPMPVDVYAPAEPGAPVQRRDDRTAILVNQGRTSAAERHVGRGLKIAAIVLLTAGLVVGLALMLMPGPGPAWPAGVARVQGEVAKACQNPDVRSEPGQVNFACAKTTRQILWVFALLTSGDNPNFADAKNGRVGLEPITPRQGGIVAWSLNLHHPYQPTNPIDSLQVAARAINNIIGGATVTGTYGNPVVQAGLESSPANCLRYTGSSKVTRHKGFPGLCARPVASVAGQAALVADVYQKWIVGAAPMAAQNAATLYENARNPGSPEVQAILKHLPNSGR
jgi:hypothetical protein